MTMIPDFVSREADEGLFSRDIDGQLVRLDKPTEKEYEDLVTIFVNGRPVELQVAEPLKDAQGNDVLDTKGRTTPRHNTILDAVLKLNAERKDTEEKVDIPTLCHQAHMTPVAVCRLCTVQVYGLRDGKPTPESRLLPACQHQVKKGMEVFTMDAPGKDGERVRKAVRVVTELLMADHLKVPQDRTFNELQQMADRFGLRDSRFARDVLATGASPLPVVEPPVGHRWLDHSSPVFRVDHSQCILCDRCIRACTEVKNNRIIGRTGKGRTTGIGFDLNDEMFKSNCVQCGECMVSCPTSAIMFEPLGEVKSLADRRAKVVPLEKLRQDPLFAEVPPKFLLWQNDLVLQRHLEAGDILCRQGDPGHSAFIIRKGRLKVVQRDKAGGGSAEPIPRTVEDIIVGEMACLSGTPRTADVSAWDAADVWEVRRNVLDRMLRSPKQRTRFEHIYRERALTTALCTSELFLDLPPAEHSGCLGFLKSRIKFVRVNPGQIILQQGALADDGLYLIRLGHVRVGVRRHGKEATFFYQGPGTVMGEIGLLAISRDDAGKPADDIIRALRVALAAPNAGGLRPGLRTATCTALDHVEMAKVDRADFVEMVKLFPTLLSNLVKMALTRLRAPDKPDMGQFLEQGLYQGQSLLVLDLDKCTRCDECTRACVRTHGKASHGQEITRLRRDGLRFGDTLVATACRSCKDAYCMIGCPVDAIHRGKHLQIVIEDHCIGCGLCERNCPYGNISMEKNMGDLLEVDDPKNPGHTQRVARLKAATCDLCDAEGRRDDPLPSCVYACPHDAAHRMKGEDLLNKVALARGEL